MNNSECENIKFNILVVEDSKVFNAKITDALTSYGHDVTSTFTLAEASKEIEDNDFDFIFLDLILPDGEGDSLIDSLPSNVRSKIIVLSADTDIQRRNFIFELGILDYFSKNNPTHLILEEIRKLLCSIEQNQNINILIVDDSTFIRKMLKTILLPKRYNIFEASNASDGEEVLEKEDIHLLLLDYEMPGMDGVELLEKIKAKIKFLELPVIMLSGKDDKDVIARVLKHGASDFIKKPFVTEELLLKCDLQVKQYMNIKKIKQKEEDLKNALKRSQQAEQYKEMFLANMSHEIRTPLNAIMGFVDLLLEDESNDKKLEYLNTIYKSGEHLLNLINDILDFTKIENNKLDINNEVFVIEELYNLINTIYKPIAAEKNINLVSKLDENLPKHFKSDFLRIKQILINLIGNAIKFTSDGGQIIFEISLCEDKKFIEFSISDTGIGIDSSNHEKVFNVFSQAENDTSKKFGGTGLGLSISSKLVKLLNGTIDLESEEDKGSRFYFRLPVVELDEEIVHHKIEDKTKCESDSINFDNKILLVEDNKTNQMFMKVLLKKLGLDVEIAGDGVIAIEMFEKNSYDLILMDENMPNMNGSEATKVIRDIQKKKNLSYTPIVALTANAIKGDREKFLNAGMDEYLSKPINKEALIEVLTHFLKQDIVYDLIEEKSEENKSALPDAFVNIAKPLISEIETNIENSNIENIIKFINLLKITTRKYKLQDLFTICLNIEECAKDSDIQSCKNFILVFKGML